MRADTRHQLKQDSFSRATLGAAEKTAHWSSEHKNKLIAAVVIAVVVIGGGLGGWFYIEQQDQKASSELSKAVRTYDTYIRPAGMPAQPDFPSFASSQERAMAAQKQFQAIVDKYPHTRTADFARYFLGLTAADLGNNTSAEQNLKQVASVRDKDLSALANLALASVYRNTNRNKDAISIYKSLADKPAQTVSKPAAQLELAATYLADQQPMEAKKIYEQVQKENPATGSAQLATTKLQEFK